MCVSPLDGPQYTLKFTKHKPQCHPECLSAQCLYRSRQLIHVQAQSEDSLSMQFKTPLSDRAGVASSGGELAPPGFFALIIKRPVKTGSRWWRSGLLRFFS